MGNYLPRPDAAYYEHVRAIDSAIDAMHEANGTVVVPEQPWSPARREEQIWDGSVLLDLVREVLDEYARMPSQSAADAVALWTMLAHAKDGNGRLLHEWSPILMLLSSEPGSGKSRVLNLARQMCGSKYGLLAEPTAAALAHILGPSHEAAFIDEADVLFGKGARKVAVRAVLNSSTNPDGTMPHMRGSSVEDLNVFGPVALAGLDVLATDTGAALAPLFSRSIVIRMRKSEDAVPRLGKTARTKAVMLHVGMVQWAGQNRAELAREAELPESLANREGDVWGPLLNVARIAGGEWPKRAEMAAADLAGTWAQDGASDDRDVMAELAELFGRSPRKAAAISSSHTGEEE